MFFKMFIHKDPQTLIGIAVGNAVENKNQYSDRIRDN